MTDQQAAAGMSVEPCGPGNGPGDGLVLIGAGQRRVTADLRERIGARDARSAGQDARLDRHEEMLGAIFQTMRTVCDHMGIPVTGRLAEVQRPGLRLAGGTDVEGNAG